MFPTAHDSLTSSLGHLHQCKAESFMGHLQSGRRVPVPASPLARQGQQPAVLVLLAACSLHSRQSDSFLAGTGNSQLLAKR